MVIEIVDNDQQDGNVNLEVPVGITIILIIDTPHQVTRIQVIDMCITIVNKNYLEVNGGEIIENC